MANQLALDIRNQCSGFIYGLSSFNFIKTGGIVVFVHKDVAHAQYVASDKNRNDGSLDFLIDAVIRRFNSEQIFSFGTSSENHGNMVNKGLLYWKESFRTSNDIQEFYSIQTKNYLLLENRLI